MSNFKFRINCFHHLVVTFSKMHCIELTVHCKIWICIKNQWKTCKKLLLLLVTFHWIWFFTFLPCKMMIDFLFLLRHLFKLILYRKAKANIFVQAKIRLDLLHFRLSLTLRDFLYKVWFVKFGFWKFVFADN